MRITGKVITSAGLSSGIDASLYLVSKLQGMNAAERLARHLEYDWDPQSSYARAALADIDRVVKADPEASDGWALRGRILRRLGDLDGAMRVARLLESEGEVFEMDLLFIPEVEQLREHPDFGELLDALGITEYWRARGCTWTGKSAVCETA